MVINKIKVAAGLLMCLPFLGTTCNKQSDCLSKTYSFAASAEAILDRDSIYIGDTIWIVFDHPSSFQDNETGNMINFENAANFGWGLTFDKLIGGNISNPGSTPAVSDFYTILFQGSVLTSLQPNRIKSFNFLEEAGRYKFRIAIIAKVTGIFAVAISNAANVYRTNDNCTKASFKITFANTNQHLYFYEQNRPGYTPSEYERTHMYCFKVK